MPAEYKLKKYGTNLDLITIKDDKFKSFNVSIRTLIPFDNKNAALCSLALDVCASCSRKYPERDDLIKALTELYNAELLTSEAMIGNNHTLVMRLNCLCDRYTIGKEKISAKAVDILLDCLYDPLLENGMLSKKYLEQCRADTLDSIDSVINNKRRYATLLAKKTIYAGEPARFSKIDQRSIVAVCTAEEITKAYFEMLRSAKYLVTITGGHIDDELIDHIIDRIKSYVIDPKEPEPYVVPSPLKPEPVYAEDRAELKQCKLIMAYKTENYNEYSSKLMCTMLGSSPFSKLFTNVREKLSLCYTCSSMLTDLRNTMIVNCGLDEKNLSLAQEQIGLQLKAIADGDFTDNDLENAKLYISSLYLSNLDSKSDMRSWYLFQYMCGTSDSPEEKGRKVSALTREDIMREAANYKLDTVFVLKPQKGGDSNG